MNKSELNRRLSRLEEQTGRNPVRIVDMTDAELCKIIGVENPSNEDLMKIAHGAEVVIIDDIQEANV